MNLQEFLLDKVQKEPFSGRNTAGFEGKWWGAEGLKRTVAQVSVQ
jgi:hypothetical protein